MLIDLKNIQVISLTDLDLEKAAFKHGYYTNLVPKKIVGKDGVERIHWVNPDKGKKKKLARVMHHREGSEADHHKEIKTVHEIDEAVLLRFSEGDKVRVAYGKDKGRYGVFRGSIAGPSPRVSVAFYNPTTGRYEAKTLNVNHIEFTSRADETTKKIVERKTVEVTNIKGETILVDRESFEKYYKDRERRKTPQERVAEQKALLEVGAAYRRADGRVFLIQGATKIGDKLEYTIKLADSSKKKMGTTRVDEKRLEAIVNKQKYERVPRVTIHKEVKVYDESAEAWKTRKTNKPLSADLESGDLHKKGHFGYSDKGFRTSTPADEDLARKILAENWPMLERVVATTIAKYGIPEGDVTPSDIIDPLVKAVAGYEPLLDTGGGIEGRLKDYARSYAKSEAEKIHEREMSTVRDDFVGDAGAPAAPVSVVDRPAVDEMLGDPSDIIASAFISKQDAIVLEEGLADEADLMSWLYGDEKILDIMKRWTGLGEFESTLSKKEAAAELTGIAYNPATMEPYAQSTIETTLLPKERERIVEAFKAEGMGYPDFMATLKSDVKLRNKLQRQRKIVPVHPKDEKVIKVVREEVKKPDHRSALAADMIRLGVAPRDVPAVMQLGDRILAGVSPFPDEYPKLLPRRAWESGSKALAAWFKERLPASVFSGKRAAKLNLPRRFDIETPFRAAIAKEEEEKAERERKKIEAKAKARRKVDI